MKRLLAVLGIICLLAGCAAPGPYVPTGGNLQTGTGVPTQPHVQSTEEVRLAYNKNGSFQPFTSTDEVNRSLLPLIYQSLFATNYEYQSTPILCKTYQVSTDRRTWTFHLENATFSDGQALTALDVVASLRASQQKGYYAGRLQHVKTIDAVNGAVVITTDTEFANLPLLLDIPIVKSSQVEASIPLGTGPYILENTADGKQLRRQPAWWCNAATPVSAQIIPLHHGTTQGELWDLYKFSNMSMVSTDSYVDFRGDYELWECENGLFMYLTCNMHSKIFSNENIRSALTFAIDRDALVKKHFNGLAHSASLPASPSFPYYSTSLAKKYSYRPEKFAQAVADAKLTDNNIIFLVNREDPIRLRVAQAIAEMLTAGGLTVTITNVTGQDYINTLKWENYDLYLGQTKLSPNMDLTAFFKEGGSLNYGAITDVAAYAMCLSALANSGNYQSLHKQVMEDGRLCPLLVRSYAVYGRRGVFPGLSPARDNIFYYSLGKTMESAKITE
jgi:peptide/nickel transport system substrate-binding protein